MGVAGKAILEQEKVKSLQHISSVNIRMSHEIPGCADRLLPMITKNREVCHTLVISPPCGGKTTLIRGILQASDGIEGMEGPAGGNDVPRICMRGQTGHCMTDTPGFRDLGAVS